MTITIDKLLNKAESYGQKFGSSATAQIDFYSDYSIWANTGLVEKGDTTDTSKQFAAKFADGQGKAKNGLRPSEDSVKTYGTDLAKWARPEVYERLTAIKSSAAALFGSADESHIAARKGEKLFPLINKMTTRVKTLVKDKKEVPAIDVSFAFEVAKGKASGVVTPESLNASAKKHLAEALKAIGKSTLMGSETFDKLIAIAASVDVKYEKPAVVETPTPVVEAAVPAAVTIDPAMLAALKAALGL